MAVIKCRYIIPYCEYGGKHERKYHNEQWCCDSDLGCLDRWYTPSSDTSVINPTCKYCKEVYGEFEKAVKSYEYYDGYLTIGRKAYREWDIVYLEIDGRVLVEEDEG